eukprot:jgi/Ulvmu1/523/UM001_0531.1
MNRILDKCADPARCPNLHKEMENVNMELFLTMQQWLRLHGKNTRPKLTDEQKAQLKICFDLMDADGSGSIDADELSDAFELLGINLTRAEIQDLLDEVDRDGSGSCEYIEYVEIMTKSLSRIREEQQRSGEKQGPDISFELMATAYRRKRLMEGLMSGDREAQNQILTMATAQLAADDGATGDGGRASGDRRRGSKAKSLRTLLVEAGFGPSERAVVKRMAAVLPPADAAEGVRDLEKLTRFGMPRLRGLRRAHVDMLVQTKPVETPEYTLRKHERKLRIRFGDRW